MTANASEQITGAILIVAEDDDRSSVIRRQLGMIFPRAAVSTIYPQVLADGRLAEADVAVIDAGPVARVAIDSLRLLRARGFTGSIVVITQVPDDSSLGTAVDSLGASCIARADVDANPVALGTALTAALGSEAGLSAELLQARRVFAAGQAALGLQHGINNPLAALLAEAQLLQLEELTSEQRASANRMVELCRRIVALVRRLDALADG